MADLKRLALGRKGFARPEKEGKGKPKKTLEECCTEEIGELEQAFRDRMAKEDNRKRQATDTEFWFAVYFPDRQGKDQFLRKYGLAGLGDKYLLGPAVDAILRNRFRSGNQDAHRR